MGIVYSQTTQGEVALTAATARTVLALISSTSGRPRLVEWGVSFDGVSATAEPVRVRLVRATADGTGTATTIKPWDPDAPTADSTGKHTYTAEPTKEAQALVEMEVHPQAGVVVQYPLGREVVLDNATTSIVCIECTAPAGVNALAYMVWEK